MRKISFLIALMASLFVLAIAPMTVSADAGGPGVLKHRHAATFTPLVGCFVNGHRVKKIKLSPNFVTNPTNAFDNIRPLRCF